ncbi:MAG TPA: HD domain-containing protein [Gammaproteobacteria bacterium]|nr:HD domain-containing protein [Gammaproteobacteria bacterium]
MFTRNVHAAFDYAAQCHAGQVRKGTQIPYLSHLMAVASLVMEAAADGEAEVPDDIEDLVIAGLLHDAVEDCGGAPVLADIRRRFGNRVADIVEHCTDELPVTGEDKTPWPERKQAYLATLEHKDDYRALLVTAADKLHNTRAILTDLRMHEREGRPQEDFWIRFVGDKPDTDLKRRVPEILWYYQSLADVISRKAAEEERESSPGRLARLAGELESAVKAMVGIAERAGFGVNAPA